VAPDSQDVREVLTHEVNAVLTPPGDVSAATAAVQGLLEQPERAERLAQAALRSAAGLTWDARAAKIEAFLQRQLVTVHG
jgi:glycosyltransferase involved in cell wall biosynthesis